MGSNRSAIQAEVSNHSRETWTMEAKDLCGPSLIAVASSECILNECFFVFAKQGLQRGRAGTLFRDAVLACR